MSFLAVVERITCNVTRPRPSRQGVRFRGIVRTIRTPGFGSVVPAVLALAAAGCAETSTGVPSDPDPAFDIEIRYWPGTEPSDSARLGIEAAAARWERLLANGLRDGAVRGDAGCGAGSPAMDETVDDLVVWVRFAELDALAESGPCLVRRNGGLPITGTIWLDGPGRVGRLDPSVFEALVMHELAHVLGFGSLWKGKGLLRDPSVSGGDDPHFVGPRARSRFEASGGDEYEGAKVPLDDSGVAGTADTHWRLFPFDDELMTPIIRAPPGPLSRVTAAAMADLGYDVEIDDAEPWFVPFSLNGVPSDAETRGFRANDRTVALELDEAPPRWRIGVVDASGRVIARLPRR